eukprot:NODE_2280_length_1097_cov_29.569072_g2262_i0.p1 GENE.NODE_2280_length_1097_cov_29.569072_g2262_i0~~NODE_2280_length_1097_cov_29.569072_g2262_i0.p1  ORF type:complete len:287 (+),score=49.38 NODE_2280_length_1097_cov_29.569072_g2262_i0:74-862(+)
MKRGVSLVALGLCGLGTAYVVRRKTLPPPQQPVPLAAPQVKPTYVDSVDSEPLIPQPQSTPEKKLVVVLDFDETLAHTPLHMQRRQVTFDQAKSDKFEGEKIPTQDTFSTDVNVLVRPGARQLLNKLGSLGVELVLWTAGTENYACGPVDTMDPEGFIRHRIYRDDRWFGRTGGKDIGRLGRDMDNVVLVDNSPSAHVHETQGIRVQNFEGENGDQLLGRLEALLVDLAEFVEDGFTVSDALEYMSGQGDKLGPQHSGYVFQ